MSACKEVYMDLGFLESDDRVLYICSLEYPHRLPHHDAQAGMTFFDSHNSYSRRRWVDEDSQNVLNISDGYEMSLIPCPCGCEGSGILQPNQPPPVMRLQRQSLLDGREESWTDALTQRLRGLFRGRS